MKRILSFTLAFVLMFSLAACSTPVSEPDVPSKADDTPVPEIPAPRPITSEQYFRHIAEGERVSCEENKYSNTTNEGIFVIPDSYVDGTPYSFGGLVFDPAMLTGASVAVRKAGSDAPGSGYTSYEWPFTPLKTGETEIMLITDNLSDDTQECRVFHITVITLNDKLRCTLNWYEDGIMGTHYELCPLDEIPSDHS